VQWGVQNSIDLYHKKVRLIPRPRNTISIGEPLDLSRFRGSEPTVRVLREVTDVMMRRLRDDVAKLRGVPAPDGELFVWRRPRQSGAA
jgi:hypothetical protein